MDNFHLKHYFRNVFLSSFSPADFDVFLGYIMYNVVIFKVKLKSQKEFTFLLICNLIQRKKQVVNATYLESITSSLFGVKV